MVNKINLIIASLYSIILAIVEALLNWGNWQYAPLWIIDYIIVIILLSAVFVFKGNIQKLILLLGWAISSGVMYMVLFINLEPVSIRNQTPNVVGILPLVGLALVVSIVGILVTIIDYKSN